MDYETFAQEHFNGNQSAIAREFGVTQGAVQYWKKNGIPPLRQAQIELWILKNSTAVVDAGTPPQETALPPP